ncbi:protein FAM217B [Danio aesculapii]|uniref:protein FAM217B n=1 Tax=Danio aesculapii TaxID=1142201 RepID=UPI0024BF4542|nr:protein FAM217B [Danio aesculapii]
MGTVLQESTAHNSLNLNHSRYKAARHAASKKTSKAPVLPTPNTSPSSEPVCQQRLRRIRPDTMLIMANPTHRQQSSAKLRSHAAYKNGHKDKRRNTSAVKESEGKAKSVKFESVNTEREDPSDCRTEEESCSSQSKAGGDDSASDISDSERYSVLPAKISPPDLDLRAEVIDTSDLLHSSKPTNRVQRSSFPDFLPPPFNSWSLTQLAVYLNTDGKTIPRPKPVGQLERYLDRLLQMEWHQIQTLQEDSSKSPPKHRHPTPHFSLSSPKCILQCQRAFPLGLLSSLTSLNLSCTHCHGHYSNGSYRQHTRSHPEKRSSGFPQRSSSESRTRSEPRNREHRLSDPLSESRHLRRMQAAGNIRNPVSTHSPELLSAADVGDVKKRRPGRRSQSSAGAREFGFRVRGRSEQRKTQQDCVLSSAGASEALGDSKESSRLNRKQKRVEFLTQ